MRTSSLFNVPHYGLLLFVAEMMILIILGSVHYPGNGKDLLSLPAAPLWWID